MLKSSTLWSITGSVYGITMLQPNGVYFPRSPRFWQRDNLVKYKSLKADCVWLITSPKRKDYLFTLCILKVTVDLKLPLHAIERYWKSNWLSDNEEQKARSKVTDNVEGDWRTKGTENIKLCIYFQEKVAVPYFSTHTIYCCSWNRFLPDRSLTYFI